MYVKDGIKANAVNIPCDDTTIETIFLELKTNRNDSILCGIIYRSPSYNNHNSLRALIQNIAEFRPTAKILIFGDFNYPEIDWANHLSHTNHDHPAYLFLEKIDDCFFTKHIEKATRHRDHQKSNCLDLILTNDSDSIQKVSLNSPLGSSDHLVIEMNYVIEINESHNHNLSSKRYAYDRGDYEAIRNQLRSIDWKKEFTNMNPNEMMTHLKLKLDSAVDEHIPFHSLSENNRSNKQPAWMNKKALRALKKKHNAYKRWIQTRRGQDNERYKKHRNAAKSTITKVIKAFEKNIAENSKTNN